MRMLARIVFFCVAARTPASRERHGHLVLLSSVSAWPFPGASHRCAGFHTLQRLKFLKHVFCNCSKLHRTKTIWKTPKPLDMRDRRGKKTCGDHGYRFARHEQSPKFGQFLHDAHQERRDTGVARHMSVPILPDSPWTE